MRRLTKRELIECAVGGAVFGNLVTLAVVLIKRLIELG